MKAVNIFLILICFFIASPVFAEFYQYTDASGNLRFTDNIADVPAGQRSQIKRYHELKPDVQPVQQEASGGKSVGAGEKPVKTTEGLTAEKVELDKEYGRLQIDKDALSKMPAKDASPVEIMAYKKQVDDLNQRINAYEKKRKTFQEKLDAMRTRGEK